MMGHTFLDLLKNMLCTFLHVMSLLLGGDVNLKITIKV